MSRALVFLSLLTFAWAVPEAPAQDRRVPRFEAAQCPFARGDWAPDVKLECGNLVVPQNRLRSDGRTIRLAIGIVRAREATPDPPLVWFGSTGSALRNSIGAMIEQSLRPERILPVTRSRDVVVFDLRGTGLSEPALCPDFGSTIRAVDAASPAAHERWRSAVRRCVTSLRAEGVDRASYNAVESAADLTDLRSALGYTAWDVYAVSYGARVALEAMRRHPQGIRSVVLSDASPPGPALAERPLWAARALDHVFAACRADTICHSAIPTPDGDFLALYREFERTPLFVASDAGRIRDSLVLDAKGLAALLERALHFPRAVAEIPFLVHEMRRGDRSRAVRELVDRSGGRETRVAWYLTNCYDQYGSAFKTTSDSVTAMVAQPFRFRVLEDCDLWQEQFADSSELAPVRSEIPTLILAGELSIEPPAFAWRIASSLSRAFVYELPGRPHGDRPIGCSAMIISQFLADPTRAPDASCVPRIAPLSFVTRFAASSAH